MPFFAPREYRPFPLQTARNDITELGEAPTMIRLLDLPRGRDVLDVGCGPGYTTCAFARLLAPRRLVGLDVDASLLAEGAAVIAARGVDVELVCGDVRALPFADASFDLVIDFGTLFHIGRPDDALREIARVLRPGGLFVHETKLNAWLSHPVRSLRGAIPWKAAPSLSPWRSTWLWSARVRDGAAHRA